VSVKILPKELKPTDEDYEYYLTKYGLDQNDTNWYYKQSWKDYIDISVKDEYKDYIYEMKDDWRDEKESEGDVPLFNEWHECVHEFEPTLENYINQNKEEIYNNYKEFIKDIVTPDDYFEDDEEEDE